MKLAEHVNIGPHRYSVKYSDHERDDGRLGSCVNAKCEIAIAPHQAETMQKSALFHECTEAVNWQLNVGLKHHQVTLLEAGLYDLIEKNPHIFKESEEK